jgi:2-polyprenyl-6-methoxyphenol hydroxylase-like FAD-dependent oxidoreductase
VTKRVAVVGSGIAGPAAVLALTRAGVVTHWIAPEPDADHDPVGETLSPAANPILSRLGLDDIVKVGAHRPSNVTLSSWGSDRLIDRNAILHLEGPGLVLDRRRFEADLRAAALSAGAQSFVTKLAAARWRPMR